MPDQPPTFEASDADTTGTFYSGGTPDATDLHPRATTLSSSVDNSPNEATQPHPMMRRDRTHHLLMGVALVAFVSLVATLLWWLMLPSPPPDTTIATRTVTTRTVTLIQDGAARSLDTSADTVAALLADAGITLDADDALVPPPKTLLADGMVITIGRARTVTLTLDDVSRTIRTPLRNPYDILQQAGITLNDDDSVWLDDLPTAAGDVLLYAGAVSRIRIQRPLNVRISVDGTSTPLRTTAQTVGEALSAADVTLALSDSVSPPLEATLSADTSITITRGTPITIQVDGTRLPINVSATTVGEALAQAGVVLGGLDYVLPAEPSPISADMIVQVVRITESIISTEETIAYETTFQADDSLPLDERAVLQNGQAGVRQVATRVRYADGVEIGRESAGSSIVQAPVNQIIAYGTQIVLRDIQTPEGTRQYWRTFRAYATSYHPAALGGDDVTAIGETLRTGIIAANPRIIPYRTDVYIPGYGIGYMADTGGARSSPYWVDLGYSDEEWVSWSRYVDVYLLAPVPAEYNALLPEWTPIRGR